MVGTGTLVGDHVRVNATLVIMAAGLGSRFGGVKQLAKVGPNGEAILDFSIKDAVSAGFDRVVLIIRSEIEDDVRAHIDEQHSGITIDYVRQDDLGPAREKPWGTLHAVLSAVDAIDAPFAVINADDYYGPSSYTLAAAELAKSAPGVCANIAFQIGKTVPAVGAVTRALCEVVDGKLTAIVETEGCERLESGEFTAGGEIVSAETPASMNFWCFHPSVMTDFQESWEAFLAVSADEPKAEAFLPTVVGELMGQGKVSVDVVASPEQWMGITNPDDFETVQAAMAARD